MVRPQIVDLFKQETGNGGPSLLCIPEWMPSNGSFSKQGLLAGDRHGEGRGGSNRGVRG